jgi:hypothetical protein
MEKKKAEYGWMMGKKRLPGAKTRRYKGERNREAY